MSFGEEGSAAGAGGNVRYSRVDNETLEYLQEIISGAKGVEDPEERTAMLSSALDEIAGTEQTVMGDAEASRLIEDLIRLGSIAISIKILTIFSDGDKFFELSTSMFGSHVAETLLSTVFEQLEYATPEESEAVEETLGGLVQSVTDYMMDFAMHRSGSHVARSLLNTICGREISDQKKAPADEGMDQSSAAQRKKKKKKKKGSQGATGLAAKVVLFSGDTKPDPPTFPRLVTRLVNEVCNASAELVSQLVEDTYGNPFVQVLAAATHHDDAQLASLVARLLGAEPDSVLLPEPLTAAPGERVVELAEHRVGSHLVELCLQLLPAAAVSALHSRAFAGRLQELCLHPTANFVVQSLIAATQDTEQLDGMLEEMQPHVGDLLRRRRSGVVAAMVAACARLDHGHLAMCRALSRGIKGAGETDSSGREQGLAELLVTLDTPLRLCEGDVPATPGQKFSPAGCVMLATILAYPQVAAQKFIESFNQLAAADVVRLAGDSGGCRVVEAFIVGVTNQKMKTGLMKKLKGRWAGMALAGCASSITVERAYEVAKMSDKEQIAGELAAKQTEIEAKFYGSNLLTKLDVATFKRDPEAWRRRQKSVNTVRNEFQKLFGDEPKEQGWDGAEAASTNIVVAGEPETSAPDGGADAEQTKSKKRRQPDDAVQVEGQDTKEKKREKKEKKKKTEKGDEAAASTETSEKKQKKKKKEKGSD